MANYTFYVASHYPNRQMASIITGWVEKSSVGCSDAVDAAVTPLLKKIFGDTQPTHSLTCNARWLQDIECGSMREAAIMDFSDVHEADFLVALAPLGYGSTAELTYAHCHSKPILLLIDPSEYDEGKHYDNLVLNLLSPVEDYDLSKGDVPALVACSPDQMLQGLRYIVHYLSNHA